MIRRPFLLSDIRRTGLGEGPPLSFGRSLRDNAPMSASAPKPESVRPNLALEIDVQTSLALSRATTRAVCAISAHAQRAMVYALEKEIKVQETQGGPVGELVAKLIAGYAQDLK